MLNGRKVLIVEDEFLIALDIQRMVEALGSGQTVLARNLSEAVAMAGHWQDMAIAIVEIHADDDQTRQFIERLLVAEIPVVLMTADVTVRQGLAPFPDLPVFVKPVSEEMLASAIWQAMASYR